MRRELKNKLTLEERIELHNARVMSIFTNVIVSFATSAITATIVWHALNK